MHSTAKQAKPAATLGKPPGIRALSLRADWPAARVEMLPETKHRSAATKPKKRLQLKPHQNAETPSHTERDQAGKRASSPFCTRVVPTRLT